MSRDKGRCFVVIINHAAGERRDAELEARIRAGLPAAQLLALVRLQPRRDLHAQMRQQIEFCARQGAILVVAGGDGTLNAAVGLLAGTDVPLGVIPCGTFNFFARDRGIPLATDAALALLREGSIRPCALARVNGLPFCVSASIGVYPRIIAAREKVSAVTGRNRLVSLLSGIWIFLTRARGRRLLLEHDGQRRVETAPMLLASVSPAQLANFDLPEVEQIRQGRMLVFVIRSNSTRALCRYLWATLRGELKRLQELDVFATERLQVSTRRRRLTLAVDGELHRCPSPLTLEVEADAYTCVLPVEGDECA
ncbi:diacylglycerol/lipid kinase family protein [Marinobacterium weihaiense]|uniref:NAD(+)/NADH kinase n=1 Tax=Marinobacterium weihaiense TaxID=2851016 RepID=A0ABS6M8F6_9GAMM|nr:diacylglycerol kinase family protein [Marinobacterium weihaiense]MBV0932572.1 NAD(+)/NADH kinase [Marinobacterium weihaiense]